MLRHNIRVWQNSFCSRMTQKFMNKLKASPNLSPLPAMLLFLAFQEVDGKTLAYVKVFPTHSHFSLSRREMFPRGAVVTLLVTAAAPCAEDQGGSRVQPWRRWLCTGFPSGRCCWHMPAGPSLPQSLAASSHLISP